ncbi:MAG: bifunctional adenosylcobinamide kinase/adenosylcobinamide-phosphate guanylyltransferase [Actinomycetota bacterium]|nr:bifunctional adenosylcobinamide kinase/adenosylcobinamide-phosphate guanylyltransferase [Actinomycetota bacterium]
MARPVTLVLGGARSGKSAVAERLAAPLGDVTYVATGIWEPGDPEWVSRLARHRSRRPSRWGTVEIGRAGDLAGPLAAIAGPVLVDSLGTWVAGFPDFAVDAASLVAALAPRSHPSILVSDEVGMGVHPSTAAGRQFRDALGDVNRLVADLADRVLLVIAGRTLALS